MSDKQHRVWKGTQRLSRVARLLHRPGRMYLEQSKGDTIYPGPMASTMEAMIGAVFNDSGGNITAVEGVMEELGISWPE